MPRGPITDNVLRAVKRLKVVNLATYREGARRAQELQAKLRSTEHVDGMHPVHAYWSFVQYHLSFFAEALLTVEEASRFRRLISAAEEEYMPLGPPMSPLTATYFFGWAYCDLAVGLAKERAGACAVDVVAELGADPALVTAMRILADSRMGLWTVVGHEAGATILHEFATGDTVECVVPAGHPGVVGERWLVRVLPPPREGLPGLVFNTPYVLMSSIPDWEAYIGRTLPKLDAKRLDRAYLTLMKHGLSARYWPEFVFDGYLNHTGGCVYLLGLPDVDGSRPHGKGFKES